MCFRPRYVMPDEKTERDQMFVLRQVYKPSRKMTVVVGDDFNAIYIKDGAYPSLLTPGKYRLVTCEDKDVKTIEIFFVNKEAKAEVKWGTANRVELHDAVTDENVKVGLSGSMEVKVADARLAFDEFIGEDKEFSVGKLQEKLRSRLKSEMQTMVSKISGERGMKCADMAKDANAVAEYAAPLVEEILRKDYGLKLCSFLIDSILI